MQKKLWWWVATGKNEEGENEKITYKNGVKCLKIASFWVINSKYFGPPARSMYAGGKKYYLKFGGGGIPKCTIYTPALLFGIELIPVIYGWIKTGGREGSSFRFKVVLLRLLTIPGMEWRH